MSSFNDINDSAATSAYPDSINALIRRMFILLEDGNFESADGCCEKILDAYPECDQAYLGKLMIEHGARTPESLCESRLDFSRSVHFERLMQFSDDEMKNRILPVACEWVYRYSIGIMNHIASIDCTANLDSIMKKVEENEQMYDVAICQLSRIPGYKNADSILEECSQERYNLKNYCIYEHAKHLARNKSSYYYRQSIELLKSISGWKDADDLVNQYSEKLEEIKIVEEEQREKSRETWNKERGAAVKKKGIILGSVIALSVLLLILTLRACDFPFLYFVGPVVIVFVTCVAILLIGGYLPAFIVTALETLVTCLVQRYEYGWGWIGPIIIYAVIYLFIIIGGATGLSFYISEKMRH